LHVVSRSGAGGWGSIWTLVVWDAVDCKLPELLLNVIVYGNEPVVGGAGKVIVFEVRSIGVVLITPEVAFVTVHVNIN
jgi:hypothetical protein